MPHTPKREKELLNTVMINTISVADAAAFFAKSDNKPDLKATELGLRRLETLELIQLRNISSQQIVWLEDSILKNPNDYEVVFNGYGYSEKEMSETHEGCLAEEIHEITKHRFQVAIESSSLLSIDGEIEGAAALVERARAFTHQFAFHLVTRNYSAVFDMFSEFLREKETKENIKNEIEKREKTYGEFELFDHVEVQNIYNAPSGWKAALDRDWWPKETDKNSRRAVSSFQLGSLVTPGGVILEGNIVSLSIVEVNDSFCVQSYRLFTGN
jgi:hypothetical protein